MAAKMTAEQVKAIDWSSLFEKLPQLAVFVKQLLDLFAKKEAAAAAGCPDVKACGHCDAALSALATAVCEVVCCRDHCDHADAYG